MEVPPVGGTSDLSDGRGLGTQQNAAYGILFDKDVASVGLTIGAFDAKDSTVVKVFDRTGKRLGQATNHQIGNEFFGFATDDGEDKIAGVQVSMMTPEDDGYHIGDITFVQKAYKPTVVNKAPIVTTAIAEQTATVAQPFNFTVPSDTFTDPDGDKLTLSASLANGDNLPDWLKFDPATSQLSGTPPEGSQGSLEIKVTATDNLGNSVSDSFSLGIVKIEPAPPEVIQPFIVDIDPTQNYDSSKALVRDLPAGEYQVEVIGTAEGGKFNAWSRKCSCKWVTYYSRGFRPSGFNKIGNLTKYDSAAEALANRQPSDTFNLTRDTDVKFLTYSSTPADNIGGLSLRVEGNGLTQFVDLDATQNVNKKQAKVCSLTAGDYTVTPIGTAEGGKYDAWSNTCYHKWLHAYKIRGDAKVNVTKTGVYSNSGEALDHRPAAEIFRLDRPGQVKFYTNSDSPDNDCGGVSLKVTPVGS